MTQAADLLREAADLIEGARAKDYGSFTDNMNTCAKEACITPLEAARVMRGVKRARLEHQPSHHDSMVDYLGYCALTLKDYGKL